MVAGEVVEVVNTFKPGQYAENSYGNTITIRSTLPDGSFIFTKYAHLDNVWFEVGDQVQKGKILGSTGNTGNAANIGEENHHVHIEVSTDGIFYGGHNRVNPETYMNTEYDTNGKPVVPKTEAKKVLAYQPHRVLLKENHEQIAYRKVGNKLYELNDHLGNVRVVITDLKQPIVQTGLIVGFLPLGGCLHPPIFPTESVVVFLN